MKKYKIQKPSWEIDNSIKRISQANTQMTRKQKLQRVKENNRIAKILKSNGWKYWDCVNIVENGFTITFIKKNEKLKRPNLYFSWYWDTEMCNTFYLGKMSVFYDYFPKDKFYHPGSFNEISPILERFMKYIPQFEKQLEASSLSQTEIDE